MQNGCQDCIKIHNDQEHTYACMHFLLLSIKFSNTKLNNDFPFHDAGRLRQFNSTYPKRYCDSTQETSILKHAHTHLNLTCYIQSSCGHVKDSIQNILPPGTLVRQTPQPMTLVNYTVSAAIQILDTVTASNRMYCVPRERKRLI
jgi:hypothetical protein